MLWMEVEAACAAMINYLSVFLAMQECVGVSERTWVEGAEEKKKKTRVYGCLYKRSGNVLYSTVSEQRCLG